MKIFYINDRELFEAIYIIQTGSQQYAQSCLRFEYDSKFAFVYDGKPKEEKLMTREEAIFKVKICNVSNYPETFVQALEALGLIKFKEEKKKDTKIRIADYDPSMDCIGYVTLDVVNVIKALEEQGYTVRENG